MNKIHRVIWNEHTGTWVAVAETAKGRGKGSGRAARKAMLAALLASGLSALPALAELASTTAVPASGKTNAYISANGVPVVNIETANAKGLSHNKFTRYDVETNGLVLNNGNNSLVSRQSQLAGQVISNLNLVQEAKIILNEVVSTNRSTLAGFTEVLGGKADVIVANPNGISCNGCGFINTDRVTLTTGTSNIAADGSLNGFNVNRGDVLIEGLGANASSQQILDIVARSVKINGKINTLANGSLGITTGSNSWNYADRSVGQPLAGEGTAPAYALDSTTLGGMYAGRIRIIATEAGVGVRMAGDAAASADDFSINSAGKIEMQSAISAARDASINSSSNSGIQDVFFNGASAKVSAKHDLAISTAGQLKLSEAELYAANQLALSAASLSDTTSTGKMRFAGGNSKLAITGNATIDGAVWGAGLSLSGNFGSLTIAGGSATLYAGNSLDLSATGNLSLATAAVRANNDLTLTASGGNISTSAGATQGIQSSSGTLRLNAGNGINNAGTMTADAGSLILRSNANVLNSGTIHAAATLDIADQNNGSTENFTNTGSLLADANIAAKAANFINTGNLQATAGMSLQANSLNNSGTLTGSTTAGKSTSLSLTSLDNSGTLQSQEDINVNIGGSLSNSGKLLATHDLNIAAANSALVVSNSASGVIQAGNALTISASKATFDTQAGTVLANDISLTLASLNNSGTVQANNAMQLAIGNALSNSGVLLAKAGLNSSSASLDNSGTLQATQGASISTGVLNNSGKLIASDSASHAGLLSVSSLNNSASGVIQSAQDLNITVSGASLSNSGKIIAADDLNLTSTGSGLSVNNQAGAYLQAGNASGDSLNLGGTAVSLNNAANAYMLGDQLSLNLASLNNAGTIQGGTASSSISTSGMLSNSGVLTLATGDGGSSSSSSGGESNISAGTLTNSGTLQSASGIAINVSNALTNDGTLLTAADLTVHSAILSNTGTLQANQGSNITTGALGNSGKLLISTSASYGGTLNVATLSNTGSGVIQSAQDLNLNLSGNSLNNAGKLIAADDLNIVSNGSGLSVTNQSGAYLQAGNASGDRLRLAGTAITLNNNAGASLLGDQLDLSLASLNNAGKMQGGMAASTISASADINNTGTLNLASTSAGSGSITANSLSNNGTLQSAGAASITVANTLTNNANLLIGGALTVRGSDTFYTLNNNGRLQSGGLMDLRGNGGGNGMDLTLGNNAILFGDSVYLNLGTLSIGNNGMLSSDKGMTINANSLSFGGSAARIVAVNSGSGSASIRLANSFSNNGAVHSGGDLTFSASSVSNTNTGGFSALNNLTLTARDGNFYNAGALYAGNQLTASTPATFTNAANSGTIDSDRDISITANTFVNDNTVTAGRDIRISANTFRNEVAGGDTRAWTDISWGSNVKDSTHNYHDSPDDKQTQYWHRDGESHQYYQGGTPGFKPQIIAANSLSIVDFSNAYNTGGVISGSTVNLSSAVSGAQFTNNDLALNQKSHKNTWEIYTHWVAFGPATYDDHVTRNNQTFVDGESQVSNIGAGIFASNLNASGFALVNQGSALSASTNKQNHSGASGSALGGAVSGTDSSNGAALGGTVNGANLGSGVAGVTNAQGKPAIHFGGLLITLPSNPNGYFVPNLAPGSKYLVETNPLFNVSSNYVGSDYMAQRYGYNPDSVIKRLGDANYEAYLIRQQLINQTGSNILKGYGDEAGQMQRLMDQALAEGKRAGFTFGTALSADQIKNLQEDVVWMVETTVAGQKVLAPVVYLSDKTRDAIVNGAVIAGDNVKMNLSSLSNTGGTISGSESLSVVSKGDISNTSGTITGGNVSLTSTEGSIRNETLAKGDGNSENYATVIGKTAGISATGNLSLDAKRDIIVKGADVDAKGNASLTAGGNVTFDTIVDKTADTTHSSSGNLLHNTSSSTTTTTENNLGSKLGSGGNLSIKSGGDTTIAGSNVDVKGDLAVDTGGSFNVIARQDKTTVRSEETTSGLGVGGGLAGKEKVTTDSFKGTNFGSTLNVGGNATIKAAKEMVVQGSNVDIKGDADIYAKKGISILDGLNEERTTTRTETTTFLKMDNAGEKKSGSKAGDTKKNGDLYASAEANAYAGAGASGTSDLKLSEVTTSTTRSGSNTSVASNFKVNGNLKAKTDGNLTVQGSNVESGGDMTLEAKEIAVLAGRNETWSNTETTTTSVGIYNEGDASAKASANGQAKAGTIGTNASGEAKASAEAGGTTTFGARTENEKTSEYKLTNSGSSLKSGGKMKIAAENTALFVGADVHADGNLDISGKDIVTLAAQDIELNSSSKTTHTAGLYIDGKVSAEASAQADAGKLRLNGEPASASGKAEAKADTSAGVRYKNEQESSSSGSVTQKTSSFTSGGSISRTATNTIVDQGTQIDAKKDFTQSAREIKEIDASDSSFSSSSSSSHDVKLGVGAGASASASGNAKGEGSADAGAGAGFRAKYEGEIKGESESSTTANTSRYKAGGDISSTSTEKTTLIGAKFESGGNTTINAGSLDYQAARDTTSKSDSSHEMSAELKVDVIGSVGGSLSAEYQGNDNREKSSTAKTGSINAGGNLIINTKGDAKFEGTNLNADNQASIVAGGTVEMKAARDTQESSSKSANASLELSTSKESKGGEASLGYAQENSSSSKAQTGSVNAGSGGIVISAGKDANFEGTKIKASGDVAVSAAGKVNLSAAKNTETSTSFGVEASVSAESGGEGSKKSGEIGGNAAYAKSVDSDTASIQSSSGKVSVKAKEIVSQEATIKGEQGSKIDGRLSTIKAEKSDIAIGIEMSASGESESKKAPPKSGSKTTDDMPNKSSKPEPDGKPRAKTTDDLPAKSASDKPAVPSAAERKASTEQLKADQGKLNQAMKNKQEATAKPAVKSQAEPAVKSGSESVKTAPGNDSGNNQLKADNAKPDQAKETKPQAADKPVTAEQRKAQINQLKADKAKLDKAMGQKTAAKPAVKSEAKPTSKADNKPAESQAKDVAPAAAAATPPNAATQQ